MKVIVAYDLDDTLGKHHPKYKGKSYRKLTKEERKEREKWKCKWMQNAKVMMRPKEKKFDIVTNRKDKYRSYTEKWIRKNFDGQCDRLIMNAGASFFSRDVVAYKAKVINDNGYKKYYENEKRLAEALHKKCPNCTIVCVKKGKVRFTLTRLNDETH